MGLQSVALDLGLEWAIELKADASAAIGICRRRGLGKVRHLHTADLWVQDLLKSGDFALRKTPGSENIADMMTKYLARPDLSKHIAAMHIYVEQGRADLAPKIAEDAKHHEAPEQAETAQEEKQEESKENHDDDCLEKAEDPQQRKEEKSPESHAGKPRSQKDKGKRMRFDKKDPGKAWKKVSNPKEKEVRPGADPVAEKSKPRRGSR